MLTTSPVCLGLGGQGDVLFFAGRARLLKQRFIDRRIRIVHALHGEGLLW